MTESVYDRTMRAMIAKGDLVAYAHTVNGITVMSWSATDPFAKIGTEAKQEVGTSHRTITRDHIERMHRAAEQVRAFYGDDAVGALPPLPKRKRTTKRAA